MKQIKTKAIWSIHRRLAVAFSLMTLITIGVGALAIVNTRKVRDASVQMSSIALPLSAMSDKMRGQLRDARVGLLTYVNSPTPETAERPLAILLQVRKDVPDYKLLATRVNMVSKVDELDKQIQSFESGMHLITEYTQKAAALNQQLFDLGELIVNSSHAIAAEVDREIILINAEVNAAVAAESTEKLKPVTQRFAQLSEVKRAVDTLFDHINATRAGRLNYIVMKDLKKLLETREHIAQVYTQADSVGQVIGGVKRQLKASVSFTRLKTAEFQEVLEQWIVATQKASDSTQDVIKESYDTIALIDDVARSAQGISDKQMSALNDSVESTGFASALGSITAVLLAIVLAIIVGKSIAAITRRVSLQLSSCSENLGSSSSQLAVASRQLSDGATGQAAAIQETASAVEQVATNARTNREHAASALSAIESANSSAGQSTLAMKDLRTSVQEINDSSEEVSRIIRLIDGISFQTHILSLNAAVEAARAGDAGGGFSVIAKEIRQLAQSCSHAAKESALVIEVSVARSKQGLASTSKAEDAIREVERQIKCASNLASEIAAASAEQALGLTQVSTSIQEIDLVVNSNVQQADQSSAAAADLASQASQLKNAVDELLLLAGAGAAKKQTIANDKNGSTRHVSSLHILEA